MVAETNHIIYPSGAANSAQSIGRILCSTKALLTVFTATRIGQGPFRIDAGLGPVPGYLPVMILPQVHLRKPCYDFYQKGVWNMYISLKVGTFDNSGYQMRISSRGIYLVPALNSGIKALQIK